MYVAVTWTVRTVDQKYLGSFEMLRWRTVEIIWTDVKNEVLQRVKEERNILHTVKRTANWIGHIWRRKCLLKHVFEGKIEGRLDRSGGKARKMT